MSRVAIIMSAERDAVFVYFRNGLSKMEPLRGPEGRRINILAEISRASISHSGEHVAMVMARYERVDQVFAEL